MQPDIVNLIIGPAGALILLLTILFGGFKKRPWWVFGWHYREVEKEKNEWKAVALRGTKVAERVVSIAEHKDNNVSE